MIGSKRMLGRMTAIGLAACVATLPAMSEEYRLAPSDGIRIKVQDWPDISGDYTVGPDGRVSLPVVGPLRAEGAGVDALSRAITEALQRGPARQEQGRRDGPAAAVEIVRFRPIFVIGDVQRPGELPFRPGLTVLQAVGIAGGYYRPTSSSLLRTDRETTMATGDIEAQMLRLVKAQARAARLEAALGDRERIAFPQELERRRSEATVAALLDREAAILARERARVEEERRSLASIKALYDGEILSLRGQGEALKREQDAVQRQLTELRGLAGRGLAPTPNIITLERTLAQNQNEQLGMGTAILRARQNIELAEQKIRDQDAERRRQQAAELVEASAETADARARIETSRDLVAEALATERAEGRNPGLEIMQRRDVVVVRRVDGALTEIAAEDGMALQPDDVLKVMPLPPRRLTRTGSADQPRARSAGD